VRKVRGTNIRSPPEISTGSLIEISPDPVYVSKVCCQSKFVNIQIDQKRVQPQTPERSGRYPVTPWYEQRIYGSFVISSLLIALTLGFITGSGMIIAEWVGIDQGIWWITHAHAHGMAQICGFTGLFTIGVGFHVVPRFRNGTI
jgi:hypothetical protein